MKVEGWEANGSVLVTAMTLVLEAEVEAAAVAMVAVAVVEASMPESQDEPSRLVALQQNRRELWWNFSWIEVEHMERMH